MTNGLATLTIQLPINCQVGDSIEFEAVVTDPTLLDPFKNAMSINVREEAEPHPGGGGGPRKPPTNATGEDRETPTGITLPKPINVFETEWGNHNPPFDKYTALRIKIDEEPTAGTNGNGETQDVYDFFINMDNLFLKSELKGTGDEIDLIKARWRYALVLVGLALLHDNAKKAKQQVEEGKEDEANQDIEKKVEHLTRALAPVLLPMIDSLGALEMDSVLATTGSGEAV